MLALGSCTTTTGESMDPRVEQDASHSEVSGELHHLLQDGMFLLHMAASTGQASYVGDILTRKPQLAFDVNRDGLSALHLASANGHISVVKELLKAGSELCLLRDKDGHMPIHTSAMGGRVHVLEELVDACSESARAVTDRGETVLHLGVKSNCFDAVWFLAGRLDDEILNCKDEEGNTVLHLAVARRQLQTVKFFLSKPEMDVNAVNLKGLTALNVLLDSPSQPGDLLLGEMILAGGGKLAREGDSSPQQSQGIHHSRDNSVTPSTPPAQNNRSNVQGRGKEDKISKFKATPTTLMLVATLIATITFQAGLSPPGGFDQKNGFAASYTLYGFLLFDLIGLYASVSIILLFICMVPRKKRMVMRILVWVMWVAVFSTALAYSFGISFIYRQQFWLVYIFNCCLMLILVVASVWICINMFRNVGWLKKGRNGGIGTNQICKRVLVVLAVILIVFVDFLFWVFLRLI